MSKKILRILSMILVVGMLAGCSKAEETTKKKKKVSKSNKTETTPEETPDETPDESKTDPTDSSEPTDTSDPSPSSSKNTSTNGITDLSMYINMSGREIDSGNDIQEEIARLTGVRVKEKYINGMSSGQFVDNMINNHDMPDLVDAGDGNYTLYQEGYLVAWDDYLSDPNYNNLREMYSDKEWELFRQADGHIYWANVMSLTYGEDKTTIHNEQAFWIQVRVLEWAGYPQIETLDEYFDLLERYYAENKTNPDGTPIIPYTCICEGWRYYSLEMLPTFLDGYPNDATVIVNTTDYSKPTIEDYNTSETARRYFEKLNEMYQKGIVDPDFDEQSYDDYIVKLGTGAVLGMSDQWWDFAYSVDYEFAYNGLSDIGCNYVPLGLTIDKDMPNRYHTYKDTINFASGVAVTTSCPDAKQAFSFLNRCLDQDILNLRFWGIEGEDYLVDDDGLFYRTADMRYNWENPSYLQSHACSYDYLPKYKGTSRDGINAMLPEEQTSEFFATLPETLIRCFNAYGYTTYVDFVHSEKDEPGDWFPMYTYSNSMSTYTPGGKALMDMNECKHEWLPEVVKNADFDATWKEYMKAYEDCNPQDYLNEMQDELDRRAQG